MSVWNIRRKGIVFQSRMNYSDHSFIYRAILNRSKMKSHFLTKIQNRVLSERNIFPVVFLSLAFIHSMLLEFCISNAGGRTWLSDKCLQGCQGERGPDVTTMAVYLAIQVIHIHVQNSLALLFRT